jgi:hypothetical protein
VPQATGAHRKTCENVAHLVSVSTDRQSADERVFRKQSAVDKLNFLAVVRKRTILTEQPPLVGEVSANFCG